MYEVKVNFYDEFDEKTRRNYLFVAGEDYHDILHTVEKYYGKETIEFISMEPISPDNFIEFSSEDPYAVETFCSLEKHIKDNVIW